MYGIPYNYYTQHKVRQALPLLLLVVLPPLVHCMYTVSLHKQQQQQNRHSST
jgi:hypothetical protein